jgi:Polysaccharide lyase
MRWARDVAVSEVKKRTPHKTVCISLLLFSAVFLVSGGHPFPASSAERVFFVGDPNLTRDLTPWDRIKMGESDFKVSDHPSGVTDAGSVSVAADPLGTQGQVYKLTTTPASNFAASSAKSDRVDLWNEPRANFGQEGQETWEHFQVLFLSASDSYKPAPGNWNWLVQHHNDPRYKTFINSGAIQRELPELAWGVDTKHNLSNGRLVTDLFMVIRGGDDLHQPQETRVHADEPLLYDHWNDMLVHVAWSHDPQKGLVEWWLNGSSIYSQHIANLWLRPDGATDHVNFEYSNYRVHADWPSTIYFSRVKLGATRESVGF